MTRLVVFASPSLSQDQLCRLFDLVPGLEFCQKDRKGVSGQQNRCMVSVVYNNPQSAAYACDKLHMFEYPPGQKMIVRPDNRQDLGSNNPSVNQAMQRLHT